MTSRVAQAQISRLVDQISTVIVGKRPQIEDCVACLLAGGHLLIEDVPGVGKTTLAHALAARLGLRFSRVQFTADLMPSDLVGVSVFERSKEEFVFDPGPVFAQVLLADEINRAGPKTQSAPRGQHLAHRLLRLLLQSPGCITDGMRVMASRRSSPMSRARSDARSG